MRDLSTLLRVGASRAGRPYGNAAVRVCRSGTFRAHGRRVQTGGADLAARRGPCRARGGRGRKRAMPTMMDLLQETAEKGASDLHLSSGEPPLMRVHGDLLRTEHAGLTPGQVSELVNSIMSEPQRKTFETEHEVDFACEL